MRKLTRHLLLALSMASVALHAGADTVTPPSAARPAALNVLFIGNSYTFANDLPGILSAMSTTQGSPRDIKTQAVAVAMASLQSLWEKGEAIDAIKKNKWDYVVLQEQSLRPIEDPERMKVYARRFHELIANNGAQTILYLTWARKNKPEAQKLIDNAYFSLGKELRANVAPVGVAWQNALAAAPSMRLYVDDGSHPSTAGSYLVACTFFQTIMGHGKACPMPRHFPVSAEAAAVIQQAVSASWTQLP